MGGDAQLISAAEAAGRLGVRPASLYAYVSRGLVASHRRPGVRGSWFDPMEIADLSRGKPRGRRLGLGPVVRTAVTRIEAGALTYRGHDVPSLSQRASFEAVAALLWSGVLDHEPFHAPPLVSTAARRATRWLPADARLVDRLALVVGAAAAVDALRFDLSSASVVSAGRTLIAVMVDSLVLQSSAEPPPLILEDDVALESALAGRLWLRLAPGPPPGNAAAVLNGYLVLLADHELATSTLAARVAASTRANPYAVVSSALGALDGPLHGTVSEEVYRLLVEAAGSRGPTGAVADRLRRGQPLPGFGHPLYPDRDPRAGPGLDLLRRLRTEAAARRRLRTVDQLLAAASTRGPVAPNSDFSLGALAYVTGMPPDAGEAIFAIARTSGWIAHALEEYLEPPLRFRPPPTYSTSAEPVQR